MAWEAPQLPVLLKGTVKWKIEDDTGRVHIFRIPGTFYAPKAPFRMLSPQHWSKEINRGRIGTKGAWCTTYEDRVTLCWDNNLYVRNVKLDPATNVATLLTAPGTKRYQIYEAILKTQTEFKTELRCFKLNTVPDNKCIWSDGQATEQDSTLPYDFDENAELMWKEPKPTTVPKFPMTTAEKQQRSLATTPDQPGFDLFHDTDARPIEIEEQDAMTSTAQLLRVHYQLGHLPFKQIRCMAGTGFLPKSLLQGRIPKCAACMYGKATRRAWRSKAPPGKVGGDLPAFPGKCVSVDQMQSPAPGLIAQLKGVPTTQRYTAATIFVDHFSRLSYVHLQRSLTSDDTV